jgi:hypothetical protein
MAKRFDDSLYLLSKGVEPDDPRIMTNARLNRDTCDKRQLRTPCVNVVALKGWCQQADAAVSRKDTDKAKKLHETIRKKAKSIEQDEDKRRQNWWTAALRRTTPFQQKPSGHGEQPSRLAYRWIKGMAGWQRSSIGTVAADDNIPDAYPGIHPDDINADANPTPVVQQGAILAPRSDQAEVDAIAEGWAQLWKSNEEYQQPDLAGADSERLDPITVDDIKLAASSFPTTTGLGVDNFSPRALLRLPTCLKSWLSCSPPPRTQVNGTSPSRLCSLSSCPRTMGGTDQ